MMARSTFAHQCQLSQKCHKAPDNSTIVASAGSKVCTSLCVPSEGAAHAEYKVSSALSSAEVELGGGRERSVTGRGVAVTAWEWVELHAVYTYPFPLPGPDLLTFPLASAIYLTQVQVDPLQ